MSACVPCMKVASLYPRRTVAYSRSLDLGVRRARREIREAKLPNLGWYRVTNAPRDQVWMISHAVIFSGLSFWDKPSTASLKLRLVALGVGIYTVGLLARFALL